jgi:hypothetical protein
MDLIVGGVASQVLHGLAALSIADHLADGPRTAEEVAERAGSDARATADLYLLRMILHDWDDDRATAILRNCRSAANEGGRALVVETVIGEIGKPDSAYATIGDMVMLCVTGGMERDLGEFDALFAASGWRRGKTYPVGAGYFGLELEAV